MNPEELAAQPQEDPAQQPQPQDDGMGAMTGGHPDAQQADAPPEPLDILPEVVNQYMDFAIQIRNDKELNKQVQSKIMLDMAQAMNYLVPLLTNDQQMEMQMKQAEMQMKQQEHEMTLQMKEKELEMKQQEHVMKLEHSQAENQLKLQNTQDQNQMKLQQQQENHQHSIVQGHEAHESKMQQQKQAAQLKDSSKPSSNNGKK